MMSSFFTTITTTIILGKLLKKKPTEIIAWVYLTKDVSSPWKKYFRSMGKLILVNLWFWLKSTRFFLKIWYVLRIIWECKWKKIRGDVNDIFFFCYSFQILNIFRFELKTMLEMMSGFARSRVKMAGKPLPTLLFPNLRKPTSLDFFLNLVDPSI